MAMSDRHCRTTNVARRTFRARIDQPRVLLVRLHLLRDREPALAERFQWKAAFVHTRRRFIIGESEHSLHRGKHLNCHAGETRRTRRNGRRAGMLVATASGDSTWKPERDGRGLCATFAWSAT